MFVLIDQNGYCDDNIQGAISPNGIYIIRQKQTSGQSPKFFIENKKNRQSVGQILKGKSVSNVAMVACWSPDSSKVALVIYYGTRGVGIWIYRKDSFGKFYEIDLPSINPEQKVPGGLLDEIAYHICMAGPWIDNNIIKATYGRAIGFEDKRIYYFANADLKICDEKGEIVGISYMNGISCQEGDKFLSDRRRYWDLSFNEK